MCEFITSYYWGCIPLIVQKLQGSLLEKEVEQIDEMKSIACSLKPGKGDQRSVQQCEWKYRAEICPFLFVLPIMVKWLSRSDLDPPNPASTWRSNACPQGAGSLEHMFA